jgi:hypothetical protein
MEMESNQCDVWKWNNFKESVSEVEEEQVMDNLVETRKSWIMRHIKENR